MRKFRAVWFFIIMIGAISMISAKNFYDFSAEQIDGSMRSMRDYENMVVLVVNTASKCGFTKQYDGLQRVYEKYHAQGLVILGFPANNFMNQEPGDNQEIAEFCRLNYGVSFPMFSKISVRGKDIHPLFDWLTSKEANPEFAGKVSWNFNKFLISKDGNLLARFGSRTVPEDEKLIQAIEEALQ